MGVLFEKVRKILYEQFYFHYDQIQLETKFEAELGTDSREMLELISAFEKEFDIEMNIDDLTNEYHCSTIITIQDAIQYIEKQKFLEDKFNMEEI